MNVSVMALSSHAELPLGLRCRMALFFVFSTTFLRRRIPSFRRRPFLLRLAAGFLVCGFGIGHIAEHLHAARILFRREHAVFLVNSDADQGFKLAWKMP